MQELDQTQELIQMLKERLNEKDETIATLQATIETLQITIANLTETLDEFKRKFFGISSEKSKKKQTDEPVCEEASEQESGIPVKEHTRTRKKKAKRDDLYALLPIEEVLCDVPQEERLCPDCGAEMEHMGYTFIREEASSQTGSSVCFFLLFSLDIPKNFLLNSFSVSVRFAIFALRSTAFS